MIFLLAFISFPAHAQVTRAGAGLTGVTGDVDLADIDGDNDLDIVVVGDTVGYQPVGDRPSAILYRNNGSANFAPVDADLIGVDWGATANFADADGDGIPDLLITGQDATGQPSTTLYLNDGSGDFEPTDGGLPDVQGEAVDWGDVDGDDDLDLVLATVDGTVLYENNGAAVFSPMDVDLPSTVESATFGDYDNDGDLDLFVTGSSSAKLFQNPGNGQLQDVYANLYDAYGSASDWADIDGDGDLDLVVSGGDYSPSTTIYRNDGYSNFTALDLGLTDLEDGSVLFGDINGDNAPDLLTIGRNESYDGQSVVYLNNGSGGFDRQTWGLTGVNNGGITMGDVEADGDSDFLIVGRDDLDGPSARLYVNRRIRNSTPGERARFVRGSTTDTLAAGLEYRDVIEFGDPEGDPLLFRVYTLFNTDAEITPVGGGAAHFALPTTRSDAGLQFNPLLIATDTELYDPAREVGGYARIRVGQFFARDTSLTQVASFGDEFAKWADYDQDGDLDLVVTGGTNSGSASTQLYENRDGGLSPLSVDLPNLDGETVEWGDIEGDGDLDLVIAAGDSTYIMTNSEGTFAVTTRLPSDRGTSSVLEDFDRDGDLDLVVIGTNESKSTLFYENVGSGQFEPREAGLASVGFGAVGSGDVDGDGDRDLLLAGLDENGQSQTLIYLNDGDANFSVASTSLPGTGLGAADFGDYDEDGDLDLLLTGIEESGDPTHGDPGVTVAEIFANDGSGRFESINAGLQRGIPRGNAYTRTTAQWGDVDADGDLDVVVGGWLPFGDGKRRTTVYENQGGGTFAPIGAGLVGITTGTAEWADLDNDGMLDLFVSGYAQEGLPSADVSISTRIYENLREASNAPPNPPSNIEITAFNKAAGAVQIAWDPATDTPTPGGSTEQAALGYDLYVKEADSGTYLDPPEALVGGSDDGQRLVSSRGGLQGTVTVVRGLDDEKQYTIGIQSVDHSFAGSPHETFSLDGGLLAPANSVTRAVDGPGTVSFDEIGLRIQFSETTSGSGTVTAEAFEDPPLGRDGITESNLSQYSYVITASDGLVVGDGTAVLFDAATLDNVIDPTTVFNYTRPVAGTGPFSENPTTYNSESNEVVVTVDGFSEFVFASDSNPLPVELSAFDAQASGEAVTLTWQTAAETNNTGFEVQRAAVQTSRRDVSTTTASMAWESVGFVEGAGTTSAPQDYRFRDAAPPFADSLVYRLKQIDTDGTTAFSPEVVVRRGPGSEVRLAAPFPNPTRQQTTVRYIVPEGTAQPVRLTVYNVLGQRVATLVDETKAPGREELSLDASGWASGVYFLRLQVGEAMRSQRVTVVR